MSSERLPKKYWCEYERLLVLDEKANVMLCCAVDQFMKNAILGSVFDLSLEDIERGRRQSPVCAECHGLRLAYLYGYIAKYRAHDVNRLYGREIVPAALLDGGARRVIDNFIVRSYLFARSKWGYFGYYCNKLFEPKRIARAIIKYLHK